MRGEPRWEQRFGNTRECGVGRARRRPETGAVGGAEGAVQSSESESGRGLGKDWRGQSDLRGDRWEPGGGGPLGRPRVGPRGPRGPCQPLPTVRAGVSLQPATAGRPCRCGGQGGAPLHCCVAFRRVDGPRAHGLWVVPGKTLLRCQELSPRSKQKNLGWAGRVVWCGLGYVREPSEPEPPVQDRPPLCGSGRQRRRSWAGASNC